MVIYPIYLGVIIILRLAQLITNSQLIYVGCLGVFAISICILTWEAFDKEITQFYRSELDKFMRYKKW